MSRLTILIAMLSVFAAAPALSKERAGLTIHPGETLTFELEDGQPVRPRPAESRLPKQGEIYADLRVDDGKTLLTITNGGPQPLNYRAAMTINPRDRGHPTSVCTLQPRITVYESWPHDLVGLQLSDFEPAADGAMVCR